MKFITTKWSPASDISFLSFSYGVGNQDESIDDVVFGLAPSFGTPRLDMACVESFVTPLVNPKKGKEILTAY